MDGGESLLLSDDGRICLPQPFEIPCDPCIPRNSKICFGQESMSLAPVVPR